MSGVALIAVRGRGLAKVRMPTPSADPAPKTVLVVDDEPGFARAVARVLSAAGFTVTTVGSGSEAAAAIATSAFEVILSDIQMPEMSGVELLGLVRSHDLDV